jgi:quinohemoprotein ethanol dehydrogenase
MPDFTGKLTEADVVKIQVFIQGTADAIRPKEILSTGQAKQ